MYSPSEIEIKNIGTIENLNYKFSVGESFVIQGKNLDNKGQKNNGVGKSFFIDAIGFAISGIILSGRSTDDFIRDGESEGSITLTLFNKVSNITLKIVRVLNRKKSQVIEIYKNDIAFHINDSDVNQRNQTIINEIGILKDDLFQFYLISKDRYKPYFRIPDNEKKEITNRFSNANSIDGVFSILDGDLSKENKLLHQLNNEIIESKAKIETYDSAIFELTNNDSSDKKQQLKDEINLVINNYSKEIENLEFGIDENQKLLEQIENDNLLIDAECEKNKGSLSNLKAITNSIKEDLEYVREEENKSLELIKTNINKLETNRTEKQNKLSEINKLLFEIKSTKLEIENQLKAKIDCPSCSFEFVLDSEFSVDELNNNLVEVELVEKTTQGQLEGGRKLIDKLTTEIKELNDSIIKVKDSYKDILNDALLKVQENEKEVNQVSLTIENLSKKKNANEMSVVRVGSSISIDINKIESLIKSIEDKNKALQEVDKSNNEENIKKFLELKEQLLNLLLIKENELITTEQNVRELNEWILKFKAFKSYLANLSIKNIEDLINLYLGKMNTDLSIEIEGYKQTGKKIVEKITETIIRGGERVGRYARFSGGERTRIDVASILANQTLINNNVSPKGLDLIVIDEVLESLDSTGLEGIIDSMENINKTMIMVTQNEVSHNNVITFVKQGGTLNLQ